MAEEVSRIGIAVDQSVIAFDANPGETHTFSLTIQNTADKTETISLEAQDLLLGDNNEAVPQAVSGAASGLKDWIRADQLALKLEPGESREIFLTVVVPQDAVVGSHAGAILARALPEITGENFQQVLVSGKLGTYLLINVKGEVSGKGQISYFGAPLFVGKKTNLQVDYQNQGNIHYVPHGEIMVKNLLSGNESRLAIDKHFVFPGKQYTFVEEWEAPSVLGIYDAKAAFVDAEGKTHVSRRYVVGKLFPFLAMACLTVFYFGIKKVIYFRRQAKKQIAE